MLALREQGTSLTKLLDCQGLRIVRRYRVAWLDTSGLLLKPARRTKIARRPSRLVTALAQPSWGEFQ